MLRSKKGVKGLMGLRKHRSMGTSSVPSLLCPCAQQSQALIHGVLEACVGLASGSCGQSCFLILLFHGWHLKNTSSAMPLR